MYATITGYLKNNNLKYKKSGDNFILAQCMNPNHTDSNPSMGINTQTGFGKCFSCGFSVNPNTWGCEVDIDSKYQRLLDMLKKEEAKAHTALPKNDGEVPLEFMRHIPKEMYEALNIYMCYNGFYSNRIIFPFLSADNVSKGFSTRAIDTNEAKKRKMGKYIHSKGFKPSDVGYPLDVLLSTNNIYRDKLQDSLGRHKSAILVEGVYDAILLCSLGIPAVSNFGVGTNHLDESLLLSLGINILYILMDKDEAGNTALEAFISTKVFYSIKIKHPYRIIKITDNKIVRNFLFQKEYKDFSDYYSSLFIRNILKIGS